MNKNPVLSVIVPVYNVEEYLAECLDSIINQTYKDIEIIVVDDGSTDNSGLICNEYAAKYDKITVYHKQNGGLSSARNYGIERANGKYLSFIDSDDFIDKDMFYILMNLATINDADIVMCGYIKYTSKEINEHQKFLEKDTTVYKNQEVLLRFYTEFCAWNKVYKKKLLNNIRFPEGKLYEDARTMYKIAYQAKIAVVYPKCLYYYRQRNSSIMNTFSTKNYFDRISVWDEIYDFMRGKVSDTECEYIKTRKNKLIIELLATVTKSKPKDKKMILKKLNSMLSKPIFLNKSLSFKEKCIVLLSKIVL